jgi:Fuc2NAc and GlcNAc transferase
VLAAGIATGTVGLRLGVATLGAGTVIAVVGFLDDRLGLPSGLRLLVQIGAGCLAVLALGPVRELALAGWRLPLGPFALPVTVLGLVWLTNLYNFMDGIDGLAAGHTLVVTGMATLLFAGTGAPDLRFVTSALAAVTLGFLPWNWAPARIFMGDVGSLFLGFILGVLGLAGVAAGAVTVPGWTLLMGVFVFDATVTLVRRMLRGERLDAAHRRHAYQRAVQSGWSHGTVAAGAMVLASLLGTGAVVATRRRELEGILLGAGTLGLAVVYGLLERRRSMWTEGAGAPGQSA